LFDTTLDALIYQVIAINKQSSDAPILVVSRLHRHAIKLSCGQLVSCGRYFTRKVLERYT